MVSFEKSVSFVKNGILMRISKDIVRGEDSSTESDDAEDTHLQKKCQPGGQTLYNVFEQFCNINEIAIQLSINCYTKKM